MKFNTTLYLKSIRSQICSTLQSRETGPDRATERKIKGKKAEKETYETRIGRAVGLGGAQRNRHTRLSKLIPGRDYLSTKLGTLSTL